MIPILDIDDTDTDKDDIPMQHLERAKREAKIRLPPRASRETDPFILYRGHSYTEHDEAIFNCFLSVFIVFIQNLAVHCHCNGHIFGPDGGSYFGDALCIEK